MKNHNGYKNNFSLDEVREKINKKIASPEIQVKKEKTCLYRYGVKSALQSPEIMKKKLNTTLQRYGVPFYSNKEKEFATKKRNNSYLKHKSKYEQVIEKSLLEKYSPEDIIYQYRDNNYPFVADFYIKSIDTYIEVNGNWTHGPHPFNANSKNDVELLDKWKEKAKTSKYYQNAIYT